MALWKRNKTYWMDVVLDGVRYRESLKTSNPNEAKAKERDKVLEIKQGKILTPTARAQAKTLFEVAVEAFIERRRDSLAPNSIKTDLERLKPLRHYFLGRPLGKITTSMIEDYKRRRQQGGAGAKTINMELSLVRRLLKEARLWYKLADEVQFLRYRPKTVPRVLTQEELQHFYTVASTNPLWTSAFCAAVLAVNTTCRRSELRLLKWAAVDFPARLIRIHESKTDAGERTIPLNPLAVSALQVLFDRSARRGMVLAKHYVFPRCPSGTWDPTRPQRSWYSAWYKLRVKAGFPDLRFHDLRHQAVTQLLESGVPDEIVRSLAGHVDQRIMRHYSHIRLAAKREAVNRVYRATIGEEKLLETSSPPEASKDPEPES